MASYTGDFELRKLGIKFSRGPSGGTTEDADWITFHFVKLTSGAPDANWLTADYTAVESAWDTFWAAKKASFHSILTLAELRWYKDGPAWSPADRADGPTNPAARVTSRSSAGTGAGAMLPPQIAVTVTEHVGIEKRRGRFYLPGIVGALTVDGRFDVVGAALLAPLVTFYNTCRAAGKQPVVWSRGRSAYVSPAGNAIAVHPATAYEVLDLQMDNLFDVMRSRRYSGPTIRQKTVLT